MEPGLVQKLLTGTMVSAAFFYHQVDFMRYLLFMNMLSVVRI